MRAKFFDKQQRLEKANLNIVKDAIHDPLGVDTEQSHDASMPMPAQGEQADLAGAMQDGGVAPEDLDDPNEIQKLKPIS